MTYYIKLYDPSYVFVWLTQHVTNIPQLKLGDIWGYHLSDIPQFSDLQQVFVWNLIQDERVYCGCYRKREIFCCSLSCIREHSKENISRSKHQAIHKHFTTCIAEYLKDNEHNSLNFAQKYVLLYLSVDMICSSKLTVFLKLCSQKTVCILEQIMYAVQWPCIILCQIEDIVYIEPNIN